MAKMKVHELAKELDMQSKDIARHYLKRVLSSSHKVPFQMRMPSILERDFPKES